MRLYKNFRLWFVIKYFWFYLFEAVVPIDRLLAIIWDDVTIFIHVYLLLFLLLIIIFVRIQPWLIIELLIILLLLQLFYFFLLILFYSHQFLLWICWFLHLHWTLNHRTYPHRFGVSNFLHIHFLLHFVTDIFLHVYIYDFLIPSVSDFQYSLLLYEIEYPQILCIFFIQIFIQIASHILGNVFYFLT